jgi:hypothetical protein
MNYSLLVARLFSDTVLDQELSNTRNLILGTDREDTCPPARRLASRNNQAAPRCAKIRFYASDPDSALIFL